jgi:hypothetical protein
MRHPTEVEGLTSEEVESDVADLRLRATPRYLQALRTAGIASSLLESPQN